MLAFNQPFSLPHFLFGSGLDLCSVGLALASSCSHIGISCMGAFAAGFERLRVRPCNLE